MGVDLSTASYGIPELLLIDTGARAVRRAVALARHANVVSTSSLPGAEAALEFRPVDLIVTEFAIVGGTALDVCRIAATAASSPSVLVMRPAIAHVPDLIEAGCDGILLNTVAPPILCSRARRILRARITRALAARRGAPGTTRASASRDANVAPLTRGTNRFLPDTTCVQCGARGVFNFDTASCRQAWYSCMGCRYVWAGPTPTSASANVGWPA
jgi:DNA-binding response OmpR family regulator